ncbi:hypothetical protein SDC9_151267 [bioreactor metagenome]|uniref:Uncharacterized protein n=1 Tax=bioreactor metagenome TaxID=1076179 RepID=A0A645EPT4_9ZZZZ
MAAEVRRAVVVTGHRGGLAAVVQQSGPADGQVLRRMADYLQGVLPEVVHMKTRLLRRIKHWCQLRQGGEQKLRVFAQRFRRAVPKQREVQFFGDTFPADFIKGRG